MEDSDEGSSKEETPTRKKKFCQYQGKCSQSTDKCTTIKALIKKNKSSKSKGFKKGSEKTYTKHEANVLIEKKLKKTFKGNKKRKQEYITLKRWKFQDLKNLVNLLVTVMHLAKAMTAEV